jgi:mRNA-degrading endonuclease RelE of RelBE toxin-antitoxin system
VPYTGLAAPSFNKDRKRFAPAIIRRLDEVQAQILQDPHRGDRKRGALRHVWVEKFKAQNDQWLVAYIIDDKQDIVYFVAVGQHENFYRDLQRRITQAGRVEKPLEP